VLTLFLTNTVHSAVGQNVPSFKNQTNLGSASPLSNVAGLNETLSNYFFITYSFHETNQTILEEKVQTIRNGVITVLREIVAQQVEKENDTETIKVSQIGFDGKTQNLVGIESKSGSSISNLQMKHQRANIMKQEIF
jgi:hypothetical protein